jgi:hypothetical protein
LDLLSLWRKTYSYFIDAFHFRTIRTLDFTDLRELTTSTSFYIGLRVHAFPGDRLRFCEGSRVGEVTRRHSGRAEVVRRAEVSSLRDTGDAGLSGKDTELAAVDEGGGAS